MQRKILLLTCLIILLVSLIATASVAAANTETVIIIDPGHGGGDGGAVGVDGTLEKNLNLSVSLILSELFENAGYETVLTRNTDDDTDGKDGFDKTEDIHNRSKVADKYENCIYISVHMNASTSSADKGFQVFFGSLNGKSKLLAKAVYDSINNTVQVNRMREVKAAPGHIYIMNKLKQPCVLVECGFITNKADLTILSDSDYQKSLAYGLYKGIITYIESE